MSTPKYLVLCLLVPAQALFAQDSLKAIQERLDRLESENRSLRKELMELRALIAPPGGDNPAEEPRLEERLEVQEARTAELAQTRIGTSSRFPVSLSGMALFNAFHNSKGAAGAQYPTTASREVSPGNGGGSFRQTIVGLRFWGPEVTGGGKVSGSIFTDFWAGTDSPLNHLLRIRTATVQVDWRNTTVMLGQDKPLISPREPESIAQVGVAPLTNAGNPWLWQPQVRIEQRVPFGDMAGLRLQGALYQTSESRTEVPDTYSASVSPARPGYQGRIELWKDFGSGRRLEIANGFHRSGSRTGGHTVPSRIYSVDWMIRPLARLDFSGLFFTGQNVAPLGALRQGFVIVNGAPRAVRTRGGYGQLAWRPTSRLSFHAFSGQQDDRNSDLLYGGIGKNMLNGGNAMYRLAPNVIVSFEGSRIRTNRVGPGVQWVTHYDLALAYLF